MFRKQLFPASFQRRRAVRAIAGLVALASVTALTACEPFTDRAVLTGFGPPGASRSGSSVSIARDGLTMAVGSPSGYSDKGYVTIFNRASTSIDWVEERVIAPVSADYERFFGQSVDLSSDGNTLVVGIPGYSSSRGRAAVFFRTDGEWSDPYLVKPTQGPSASDQFGTSVAISGDGQRLVVGAPYADDAGRNNIGKVYFFEFDGTQWNQKYTTVRQTAAVKADEHFGYAVDMNEAGTSVVVGSPNYAGTLLGSGVASVMYRLANAQWATNVTLLDQSAHATSGGTSNPRFGTSVAFSGDGKVLAIGARGEDYNGSLDAGVVNVFQDLSSDGSAWSLRQRIGYASAGAQAGYSVAVDFDGSHVFAGAYGYLSFDGLASLWVYNGTKYEAKKYKFQASDSENAGLGYAVAIAGDGQVMAAGAPFATNQAGLVRTFDLFTKPGKPTAVKGTAGDGSVLVEWTAPADNGGLAPTYTVVSTPGSFTCSTASTSCIVSGLSNDTAYTFIVTPTNGAGVGTASDASTAVTPKAGVVVVAPTGGGSGDAARTSFGAVPSAPRDVVVVPGWKRATVSWSVPVSDGGQAVQSYEVTAMPGGQKCVTTTELSCLIKGLRAKKSYTFSVIAVNIVGASEEAKTEKFGLQPKVSLRGGPKASTLAAWQGIATGIGETTSMRLRGKAAKANCKIVDGRLYAKVAGTQCKVTVKSRYLKTLSRTLFIQTVRR